MILKSKLKSLNEEELELLGYIVNCVPEERKEEIEVCLFHSLNAKFLSQKMQIAYPQLNESGRNVFHSLVEKLK